MTVTESILSVQRCPYCPHFISAHINHVCGVCECGSVLGKVTVRDGMRLTREQFIHQLICAGWTPDEARMEWEEIDNEDPDDWEGQL